MRNNTTTLLSKTDYLIYRECKNNAWYKIHKPEIYSAFPISEFDKLIMETGNEVELVARNVFPQGILIKQFGVEGQRVTQERILNKDAVLFQPTFIIDGFQAKIDVLKFNSETNNYFIYEIKSKNDIDRKIDPYDLAFQVNLLRKSGLKIESINLMHLNREYVRSGELVNNVLFKIVDLTNEIEEICEEVSLEMDQALKYLSQESLSEDFCFCIYKGRSNHCTTFSISNPNMPQYSVHDINNIGKSKAKLSEMIDSKIFEIDRVPQHIKLSISQQNQIDTYRLDKIIVDKEKIKHELNSLQFPLYFLDYETFPAAIPRFDGFSPYDQIPFQYSLYVLKDPDGELKHLEFIYTDPDDPTKKLARALQDHVGNTGSVIVWYKTFECGRNNEIAERLPEFKEFIEALNNRVYDLMDVFKKQYYVHKDFKGSASIKNVLPVLIPSLSYEELSIHDGGEAAQNWDKIINENISSEEKEKIIEDLKIYCGLDTLAMYRIWKHLYEIVS